MSPSIRQLGGYEPAELIGQSAFLVVAPEHFDIVQQAFRDAIAGSGARAASIITWFQRTVRSAGSKPMPAPIVDDEGRIDGVISIVRDIAARKETEQSLTAAALTDPLTALPNRRAFRLAVEKLKPSADGRGRACLAMFDIDHFKRVNDRFGHDAGDAVLCRFAEVARIAGAKRRPCGADGRGGIRDPFSTYVGRAGSGDLRAAAVEIAATTIVVDEARISVTVSGGVAALGEDGLDRALEDCRPGAIRRQGTGPRPAARSLPRRKLKLMLSRSALRGAGQNFVAQEAFPQQQQAGPRIDRHERAQLFWRVVAAGRGGHHHRQARVFEADRARCPAELRRKAFPTGCCAGWMWPQWWPPAFSRLTHRLSSFGLHVPRQIACEGRKHGASGGA